MEIKNKYHIYVNGKAKITYFDLAEAVQSFHLMCCISKQKYIIDFVDGQTGEVLDSNKCMAYVGKEF